MTYKLGAGNGSGYPVATDNPNAQIASKLRALYLSVQEEAIPDKFLDLLEKLDAVERLSSRDSAR